MTTNLKPRGPDLPSFVPTFYPIVIALSYFGLLFVGLGVSVFSASRLFLGIAITVAAVSAVVNLSMRDRNRGGILCLVLIFLALFGSDPRVVAVGFMTATFVIVERVVSLRRSTRVPFRTITLVGNAVALILVLTLVITGLQNGSWSRVLTELAGGRGTVAAAGSSADHPDIYVIVLDGYERPSSMPDKLGFDDSQFVEALESRDFTVASNSRSNYLLTALSLPSLLNMRHVADLWKATPAGDGQYRALVRSFSADNAVFRHMRTLGYQTVAVWGGFEEIAVRNADRVIDTGQINEFELAMARATDIGAMVTRIAPTFFADSQRDRVIHTLEAAARVAEERHDRPLFTFVHVPSPHGPIVFGARGDPVAAPAVDHFYEDTAASVGISAPEFRRRYAGQIQYLNGRVIDIVDRILAASPRPPIVILLSDHGSGSGVDWGDLAHSDLDERSANLFAAYTPGRTGVFPDDITLVNVFARLFNAYFDAGIPLQADKLFRWDDQLTHLIAIPRPQASR